MKGFIHIRTAKFPVLEGEAAELVNEGMYGKALGLYLRAKLEERGYACAEPFCEDWGWALVVSTDEVSATIGIYAGPADPDPAEYACTVHTAPARTWSWRRLRFVDLRPHAAWHAALGDALLAVLRDDPQVEVVGVSEAFPL